MANISGLPCKSSFGLCTHDDNIERSDDDHIYELERCPHGDKYEYWVSDVDDFNGVVESAREMNIFFMHRTISSDS